MKVIAEFDKPKSCETCPCFYQTEGAFCDICQLTNTEIKDYFIVDKSCPLKEKNNGLEEQLTKAKEIIKKYLSIGVGGKITQNYLDVTKEAEQFINSEVENDNR